MKKILLILLSSLSLATFAEDMQIRISAEQIANLAIKVGDLVPSKQVPLLNAPARVVVPSNHEQLISAPQPGFLSQLHVNIGDKVGKGQVVAQIHSPELVALQQQFLTARSEMHLSSLEQRRDQKLLREGVIAERRWQQTQALYNSKAAIADEARQLLGMAGMSDQEIEQLSRSHKLSSVLQVRSPISGVVLDRMVTLGARLDMQAPLYRVADLSELWLEINVPQEKMQGLRLGDLVEVENTGLRAKITLLGQSVNRENQTIQARANILGQHDQLRVGQNLNVQILLEGGLSGFRVPNTGVAQNAGKSYVFVRTAEGFAVTQIQVLGKQEKDSLISGAFAGNEQIAIQGAAALKATWLGLGGAE